MKIMLAALLIGCGFVAASLVPKTEVVTSLGDYERVLGADGKYRDNYFSYNEIWPLKLPKGIKVQSFYYKYYNPFDPNLLGYLKVSYGDNDDYSDISNYNEIVEKEDLPIGLDVSKDNPTRKRFEKEAE